MNDFELSVIRDTTPEKLDIISYSHLMSVRHNVAIHENVSIETLTRLINDKCYAVLKSIVSNPKTTSEIIDKIHNRIIYDEKHDKSYYISQSSYAYSVKLKMSRNPNTPQYILEWMSNDSDQAVRNGVASNPNSTPEALENVYNYDLLYGVHDS